MRGIRLLLLLGFFVLFLLFLQILPETPPKENDEQSSPAITAPIIRATDPKKGNVGAPVVLVEFGDFACPSCKAIQPILHQVLAEFPDTVLHVWKDFPLPTHPLAKPAHIAAQCANEQGKFWEYHDRLFDLPSLAGADYAGIAASLGTNSSRFTECLKNDTIAARVTENFLEGRVLQVDQTPYFFINNERIAGIITKDGLRASIREALQQ